MIIVTETNRIHEYKLVNGNIYKDFNHFKNIIFFYSIFFDYLEYKFYNDYYKIYHYIYELCSITYYNCLGKLHREDGPAEICYNKCGEIHSEKYYINHNIINF